MVDQRYLAYLQAGDFEAALADLDKSLARAPHSADARLGKVLVWQAAKNYAAAAELLTSLLAEKERLRTADLWYLLGDCCQKLGDDGRAEEAFSQSLALEWQASTALAVGQVRTRLRRHRDAVAAYCEVIERFPESAEAYVERAAAFGALGDHDRRRADLERAVSFPLFYPRAHREFAKALLADALPCSTAAKRAMRHARVACAATLGTLDALPILVDALVCPTFVASERCIVEVDQACSRRMRDFLNCKT